MARTTTAEATPANEEDLRSRREPMSERAYRELKHRILTNHFQGGEYILEDELAKMLGMSRTPIREALVQLQNEGHLQIVPRRGARIVPLSLTDIREIYDLLQTLESHAAELVARRDDRKQVADQLAEAVDAMRDALKRDSMEDWAIANERFHRRLVELSENSRLVQFCSTLLDQSHRVRVFTLRLRKPPTQSTDNHAELIRAIRRGDADKAREIHVRHKDQWLNELTEIVERVGLRRL
jgi:DNA-binding GntR family transcriptional regulator